MTVARRSRVGTRRAADDQSRSLQRRGTARTRSSEEITPTELHYVRSNFALPAHDGTLEIGGAVGKPHHPHPRGPARAARPTSGRSPWNAPGNGRLDMRPLPTGEPWGDYAVSTARWTGALLSDVLGLAQPAADGVDVRFEGADHGPTTSRRSSPRPAAGRPDLRPRPAARRGSRSRRPDILVAYEMNGEPLSPDHGAPFRLIVPHWYAVASVKWLKRIDVLTEPFTGEFQTGHYIYQWPDRPQEAVSASCACARASPTPLPAPSSASGPTRSEARRGRAPDPSLRSTSASPAKGTGTRRSWSRRSGPYQWQDWSSSGTAADVGTAHPSRPGDRRRRQRATRRPAVEPAGIRQQRHRGQVRRPALTAFQAIACARQSEHLQRRALARP